VKVGDLVKYREGNPSDLLRERTRGIALVVGYVGKKPMALRVLHNGEHKTWFPKRLEVISESR
jgi:hypothetical protein